jgi:outer membrane protein assembly factor BamB
VLHALHRSTGAALWKLSLDQELVHRPVAVDSTHFVATTFAGTLMKLEAQTGRIGWRRKFSVPSKSPVVAGATRWETTLPADVELAFRRDKVAAYSDERLSVLRVRDGEILLDREFATSIIAAHWLDERRIAVFLRDLRNQVRVETVSV